MVTIV
jgi:hypothetical protein